MMETRFLIRAVQRPRRLPLSPSRNASTIRKPLVEQANPIGDYYASILSTPSPTPAYSPKTSTTIPRPPSAAATPPPRTNAADILFSSRLSSPLERRSEIARKSTLVAGVWVPPRPTEPDNCCMSGCVNCVYDRYRDELEEWAAANQAAKAALNKESALAKGKKRRSRGMEAEVDIAEPPESTKHMLLSMDDDGGGTGDLFGEIPVGIREFMKTEKMLKEKHSRERSSLG